MTAARAVSEGKSVQDVTQLIKELDQRSYLFAALDTLEFLKHSGRVPSMLVDLASLLRIKPVILLRLGGISLVDRIRTSSKQIEVLIKLARQQSPLEWIGVAHTNAAEKAAQLAKSLRNQFQWKKKFGLKRQPRFSVFMLAQVRWPWLASRRWPEYHHLFDKHHSKILVDLDYDSGTYQENSISMRSNKEEDFCSQGFVK